MLFRFWGGVSVRCLPFQGVVALLFASLFLCYSAPWAYAQGVITTMAGSTRPFRGDGGVATSAPLGRLSGVASDTAGNVYAADSDNNIVVKISPAGTLTVVAGNGIGGFSGDGGPATNASLDSFQGVVLDAAGNLYIADSSNNRVRKVRSDGTAPSSDRDIQSDTVVQANDPFRKELEN